jgi:tRNA dimethylallyltransferase
MQQATRRYAKRQGTWFRRETWLQTICLDSTSTPESAAKQVIDHFPGLKSLPHSYQTG